MSKASKRTVTTEAGTTMTIEQIDAPAAPQVDIVTTMSDDDLAAYPRATKLHALALSHGIHSKEYLDYRGKLDYCRDRNQRTVYAHDAILTSTPSDFDPDLHKPLAEDEFETWSHYCLHKAELARREMDSWTKKSTEPRVVASSKAGGATKSQLMKALEMLVANMKKEGKTDEQINELLKG